MENKKSDAIETVLNALPMFLAFIIPLFFLPITSEFFEFNKLALITLTTIVMLLLWVAKMIVNKKVEVTKSPLDLPLGAFLAVALLATIFSLHKVSSLFGGQGRWFPSLFSLVTLAIFYYTTASNVKSVKVIKNAIYGVIAGISISSIAALCSYFGIKFGTATFLQIPNFTTTGSTVTATVLASLAIALSLTRLLSNEKISTKVSLSITAAINFLAVLLLGSTASWAALVVGLLTVVYFTNVTTLNENKTHLLALLGFMSITIALMVLPVTRSVLVNENYPKELTTTPRESWIVASSVMRDFPLLGTGPSTFGLNYTRYKPLSVNGQEYWNVRFDKPYSEVFTVISGLGLLGVIITIALVIKTLKFALEIKEQQSNQNISAALSTAVVVMLTSFTFTYATVTTSFMLVLFMALMIAKNRIEKTKKVESVHIKLSSLTIGNGMSLVNEKTETEMFQYIMAVPMTALALAGSFYMYKQYTGEYFLRSSIKAAQENNGSLTYLMQQKAIAANEQRDAYHIAYANTNLALANSIAAQEDLSDEDKTTIQTLISQAIRSTRVTTEVLNPLNSGNWEARANTYRSLVGVAEDAQDWAIKAYNAAIQLDPANARLRLALGGIYYSAEDYLTAANMFNQAVSLKGDYANAHYNLAQALKQLQKYPEAQRELLAVQRLTAPESQDYAVVTAELEEIAQLVNVAGTQETKPNVDEIFNTGEPIPEVPVIQEPLTNVGEGEDALNGTDFNLENEEAQE